MKIVLIFISALAFALAVPVSVPVQQIDSAPPDYKNIEILTLESAVEEDGRYSYSFENDDGSKVSQEGENIIIDDDHAIESIRGGYSYTDVDGKLVSITYTADENGFRPVGAHLPTPPPIPIEIQKSLRFLATAKPFVDEQLYDYTPKTKVYRGRQAKKSNVVSLPTLTIEAPGEVKQSDEAPLLRNSDDVVTNGSVQAEEDSKKDTSKLVTTVQAALNFAQEGIKESKKTIEDTVKKTVENISKVHKNAAEVTKENADDAKVEVINIKEAIGDAIKINGKETTSSITTTTAITTTDASASSTTGASASTTITASTAISNDTTETSVKE